MTSTKTMESVKGPASLAWAAHVDSDCRECARLPESFCSEGSKLLDAAVAEERAKAAPKADKWYEAVRTEPRSGDGVSPGTWNPTERPVRVRRIYATNRTGLHGWADEIATFPDAASAVTMMASALLAANTTEVQVDMVVTEPDSKMACGVRLVRWDRITSKKVKRDAKGRRVVK